ncbi:tryptophan 2,3-dioxygenase [Niastella yeongjuensis]|uniref:Tryptophan 2,3-dioxygenase n=1 Tax=Niastella yeongjuensis TaxID=354355 RepID=A0A1V9EXS7_9BACT|nr:tryptophan 2,3-dioxygenase family protein [Niastella yeongjuensis]OQP50921.1 tryptophan 2,3-dioxygenase [Niastella yeongjuensis]SEN11453.1 tryptophan 2,3-dioxygenase [Niastella yeongjuensis]
MEQQKQVHYSDYLQLDKILNAQTLESDLLKQHAHDEMLFIVIHQAYELWFKQLLFEIDSVAAIMQKPAVNDNSPELQTVVHRLNRMVTILKVLVHQIDIMETMTPMDFLDFRDMLRPASGFQSWQFKLVEAKLGLKYQQRHGQEYYISQLRQQQIDLIKQTEKERSVIELLNAWLERMPFFDEVDNWTNYKSVASPLPASPNRGGENRSVPFWVDYRYIYASGLAEAEQNNIQFFDAVFSDESASAERQLSPKACRAALFIMLYRGYPILQLPFQLLNGLLEIDEQLSTWRYRHMSMVQRMIGTRIGTGGSTGRDYLKGALDKHYIFAEISRLTSFLIERRKLPVLSHEMEQRLGFVG